jgi:uncharacterized protein (DUF2225 family)
LNTSQSILRLGGSLDQTRGAKKKKKKEKKENKMKTKTNNNEKIKKNKKNKKNKKDKFTPRGQVQPQWKTSPPGANLRC